MSSNESNILALRDCDLVFSKNCDGIVSCGFKVSNALLNSTLSLPMGGGNGPENKHNNGKNKNNDNDLKTAKLMEDLVVPSSLYYCRPTKKTKVFNYKKGKPDKGNKKVNSDNDSEGDDNVIEESLYDKLLSLVSTDKKVKYDKKTRKVMSSSPKRSKHSISPKTNTNMNRNNLTGDATGAGDNSKIKLKNKKTRKVRFDV
jgi:hypothetical protein